MKVIIIGGGASGMMAALTAREENHTVMVFERQQRVGKKLLATGNGRCNITNMGAGEKNYHGENARFVKPALSEFSAADARSFFETLGLLTVAEESGRAYPLSDSANSVVDVLRFAMEGRGIELRAAELVTEIRREGNGFRVVTDQSSYTADKVIVACGGMAGAKVGGVKDGYALLESLGHSRTRLYPALVQITTEGDMTRSLKGVRADCRISLYGKKGELDTREGEIQFTEKGISGPVSFELSRSVSTSVEPLKVRINFFRGYEKDAIRRQLEQRRQTLPMLGCEELLTGLLHNRLGKMMIKYSGIEKPETIGELTDRQLSMITDTCFGFTLNVKGTEGFDNAQVTAGGIRTTEFDPRTMESRICHGLYACGEVLDIDGDCGGYNLQWAWSSGRMAGRVRG